MCKCLLLHPLAIVLLVFHPLQVAQADGAAIDQPVKAEDKNEEFAVFQNDIIPAEEVYLVKGPSSVTEREHLIKDDENEKVKRLADPLRTTGSEMEPLLLNTPATTTKPNHQLWENNRVPFKYSQTLDASSRLIFLEAMEHWSDATCITFTYARPEDVDYLLFSYGEICSSNIGRKGGHQVLSITEKCSNVGDVVHLLGNALGLWQEHTRPDRDDYIEIVYKNIVEEDRAEFLKMNETFNLVPDVGYDIQSIMHFGPYAFSINGGKTIKIKEGAYLEESNCPNLLPMGQRERLSYKDKLRMNSLYSCDRINIQEPDCVHSKSTTTAFVTTPTTPLSILTPPFQPRPKPKRLKTGDLIVLKTRNGEFAIKCSNNSRCMRLPCYDENSCHQPSHQFQIINHQNTSSKKIKSGGTVLLRSVNHPSNWLDCSNITSCTLSECLEENIDSISSCSKHHLQILGKRRPLNKLLNTANKILFKHPFFSKYLNCRHDFCELIEDGVCSPASVGKVNRSCSPESFKVIKL